MLDQYKVSPTDPQNPTVSDFQCDFAFHYNFVLTFGPILVWLCFRDSVVTPLPISELYCSITDFRNP